MQNQTSSLAPCRRISHRPVWRSSIKLLTVEHRTQLHFDEFSRAMLQLPIRLGGVGLCRRRHRSSKFRVYGPQQHGQVRNVGDSQDNASSTRSHADLHELAGEVRWQRYMADLDTFTKHFCYTKYSSKLQSRIVSAIREHNYSIFSDKNNLGHEERAHLSVRKNKHSAAAWKA